MASLCFLLFLYFLHLAFPFLSASSPPLSETHSSSSTFPIQSPLWPPCVSCCFCISCTLRFPFSQPLLLHSQKLIPPRQHFQFSLLYGLLVFLVVSVFLAPCVSLSSLFKHSW